MATTKAQIAELKATVEHFLEATLGLDATHIRTARVRGEHILDRVAGFSPVKWSKACEYIAPTGSKREALDPAVRKAVDADVWKLQDGYGAPGYTPAQGWDWSGIRDSSREAKVAIIAAVEWRVQRYL